MRGLKARDGFVGNGIKQKKHSTNLKVLVSAIVALVILGSLMVAVFASSPTVSESVTPSIGIKAVQQDLGPGYKNPQVVDAGDYFIAGTVNYGVLTITLINATDGTIVDTFNPASDVNSWRFRIATDYENEALLVTWLNGSGYINGTFMYNSSSGIVKTANFTIASNVGTTGYGLAYGAGKHLIVWSDNSYHNYGVLVTFNSSDPNSPIIGTPFEISADTHSHANNFVAYDNSSNEFLVLWRNYSGLTGLYNITGKLFDVNGNALTGDITIADGVADDTEYDYPSAEGGPGVFFVSYVNYNSPYDVHGAILDAAGTLKTTFLIDNSAQYGVSFSGIAYDGNNFIVDWTNSSYDIVAMLYDTDGNPLLSEPLVISNTTDSEEWQDVAYNNETGNYYFIWYDYTAKHDYGALWTHSEIPEFSAILPVIAVAFVALFVYRRKH